MPRNARWLRSLASCPCCCTSCGWAARFTNPCAIIEPSKAQWHRAELDFIERNRRVQVTAAKSWPNSGPRDRGRGRFTGSSTC
jgi:hypothetical protein